ncbi:MAG: LysR family transcriptional regulator [Geminicoccaceae bacterium]|nr:LysR family transcriptional regulator [Geminicoccaceae bacterium]
MPLPRLRALQAFEAVGRLGSITGAAGELGVSPSAVTQQVRALETLLGTPLLERRGKGLELNAQGRVYHAGISLGFRQLEAAQDALVRAQGGALRVSCLPSVAAKWLSPLLFDWQARHADAVVHLVGTEVEPRLGEEGVDFRVSYGRAAGDYRHRTELFTDWVAPACAPAFLERHPVETPEAILRRPLLRIDWSIGGERQRDWDDWAVAVGASPPTGGALSFSLSSAAIDAAAAGRGFVLAPLAMMAGEIAAGRLVVPHDVRLPLPEAYFVAWGQAALAKPFAAAFRDWLIAAARRQGRLSRPKGRDGDRKGG